MNNMPPLLRMENIEKSFFGVPVLKKVSFELQAGEVHALLGENGAGKSTLIKILNGDYHKDGGTIYLEGQPAHIASPHEAEQLGIRMIYQELHYAPDLSVMENMLLGHLPQRSGALGKYFVDWRKTAEIAREYLGKLQVNIDPRTSMRALSVVEREIVEIVKALSTQARILVMDEPTAALTPHEVDHLFEIVHTLREQGVAIIYISHRLDEVFRIAQRATVLRDGANVGTRRVSEVTQRELVEMMVGRDIGESWSSQQAATNRGDTKSVLEVINLTKNGAFDDISLQVRSGEILGIFGLLGAGHVPLTRAVFGAETFDSGQVRVNGQAITVKNPRDARKNGIGFVPIDRKVQGLVLERSVRENITLSNWRVLSRFGFFRLETEQAHVKQWGDQLGIRMAGGVETKIRFLSGGNQQKAILARWLEANVEVLLLNEPTWGVDVGARFDIYEQLAKLAQKGLAILMVSSDIQEVLSVSHRILTIYKGRLTGEFTQAEATQDKLLHAAAGGETDE